jgi:hypothetical protein
VNLRAWISSAGVSLLESITSFGIVAVDKSQTCDFGVLFSDEELSAHPFCLAVLVDVNWNFTVVFVEVLFGFLLILLLFFWLLIGWWAAGVEENSQVVVAVLSDQLDLGSGVIDVPSVVVEEVNVLVGWWLVLWFVFDLLVKFFSEGIFDSWEGKEGEFVEFKGLWDWWGKNLDH